MIVITSLNNKSTWLEPGDEFHLRIRDGLGCEVSIYETITVAKVINFIASFRFALDDGTCPGFHLTGVFANRDELPKELKEAKLLEDLTPEQYRNFVRSVGVEVGKKTAQRGDPNERIDREPVEIPKQFLKRLVYRMRMLGYIK